MVSLARIFHTNGGEEAAKPDRAGRVMNSEEGILQASRLSEQIGMKYPGWSL